MKGLKHVVITGGSGGLGSSLAVKYNEQGYHVTLIGRSLEKLESVTKKFNNANYSIYSVDVSSASDVKEVFSKIKKDVGAIDILINSAGVGYFYLAENINVDQVNKMIDINLKGTIFCTQEVLPSMKERKTGSVINIISTAGLEGKIDESVYCASKFGVKGFTESIIKELSKTNIRVHGVYMGGMNTKFWGDELEDQNVTGLMDPNDVADIIILNTQKRTNISVEKLVIRNH